MSEKRFVYEEEYFPVALRQIRDTVTDRVYDLKDITDVLNEQQSTIDKLRVDIRATRTTIRKLQDLCGESDGENAKLRIENKRLQEEKEYWESKAMTLLLQVRRLTSRMTDKEVKEFSKELEDE